MGRDGEMQRELAQSTSAGVSREDSNPHNPHKAQAPALKPADSRWLTAREQTKNLIYRIPDKEDNES